jgi:hypothetical protein
MWFRLGRPGFGRRIRNGGTCAPPGPAISTYHSMTLMHICTCVHIDMCCPYAYVCVYVVYTCIHISYTHLCVDIAISVHGLSVHVALCDQVTVFGMRRSFTVRAHSLHCSKCTCQLQWDGDDEGIFRFSANFAITYELGEHLLEEQLVGSPG